MMRVREVVHRTSEIDDEVLLEGNDHVLKTFLQTFNVESAEGIRHDHLHGIRSAPANAGQPLHGRTR